jgi:branched-chain amino acid transport system substrate-binding protein
VFDEPLDTSYLHAFYNEAAPRLKKVDSSGPLPDRYVQSNFEAVNALKLGIEKSHFQGREDSPKLVAALEGLEMKEGPDFPTGDKVLRKEDHQVFMRELIYVIKDGKYHIQESVSWEKTRVPPACRFAAA